MSDEAAINNAALEKIRELGDNDLVVKIIDLFVDYAATKIAEAREASSRGDLQAVQFAVHPIKSSAGNVGADHVRAIAQQIEKLASEGQAGPIPARIADLETAFATARDLLLQHRTAIAP